MSKKELLERIELLEREIKSLVSQANEQLGLLAKKLDCEFEREEYIGYDNYESKNNFYGWPLIYTGEKIIKKRYILKPIKKSK